jgi:hypothetical protein
MVLVLESCFIEYEYRRRLSTSTKNRGLTPISMERNPNSATSKSVSEDCRIFASLTLRVGHKSTDRMRLAAHSFGVSGQSPGHSRKAGVREVEAERQTNSTAARQAGWRTSGNRSAARSRCCKFAFCLQLFEQRLRHSRCCGQGGIRDGLTDHITDAAAIMVVGRCRRIVFVLREAVIVRVRYSVRMFTLARVTMWGLRKAC